MSNNNLFSMQFFPTNRINLFTVLLFLFVLLLAAANLAHAQTSTDDPWSPPVNLSHSGGSTNPVLVEDAYGVVHIVWGDKSALGDRTTLARSGYARYNGDDWEISNLVAFPFSPYVPLLVANEKSWVHALWIDDEKNLMASRVLAREFGNGAAWEFPTRLARSALDMDAVVDENGVLHLIYLNPMDEDGYPAGIYYRRTSAGGQIWGLPVSLYNSAYFHSLIAEDANLDIAYEGSGENSMLYATWDHRSRKQIFMKRSSDQGKNWMTDQVIAGPDPGLGSSLPHNLKVSAQEGNVLLVWQVGEPNGSCIQYFQNSYDHGESWSESLQMLDDFADCPKDNHLIPAGTGLTVLMTSLFNRPFLMAWDGAQWSEPQHQSTLTGFEDPEIYTHVTLGCLRGEWVGEDSLFIVGCDLGDGGDIWATSRILEDSRSWFPPPPPWSEPAKITSGGQIINAPSLLVDDEGLFHAFWTQIDETAENDDQQAVFYTRWEGTSWSQPSLILDSQSGDTRQPSAVIDHKGRINIVWSDNGSGELYFSWANAEEARYRTEWAPALTLPVVRTGIAGHDLLEAQDGSLIIAYALPLNEERGVYLIESNDSGASWSSSEQVFDGVSQEWAMVGSPQLAQTSDGTLHLLWTHLPLPDRIGAISLYYAHSQDGGKSWSEPTSVSEGKIDWYRILGAGDRVVHLTWLDTVGDYMFFNHQISADGGHTWIYPVGVALGTVQGTPGLTVDEAGRLHLLPVLEDINGHKELHHRIWDGERWLGDISLDLVGYRGSKLDQAAAAVAPTGSLGVVLSGVLPKSAEVNVASFLIYTGRSITIPESTSSLPPILTAAPTISPTTNSTMIKTSTPIPPITDEWADIASQGPVTASNKWIGVILGCTLGLILVVISFSVRFWKIRAKFGSVLLERINILVSQARRSIKDKQKEEIEED